MMRSFLRAAPGVVLLALLVGCSGNSGKDGQDAPPDRPPKEVVGSVTLHVPGMT